MAVDGGLGGVAFLVGRILFGGLLAYHGLNHFQNREMLTGYAEAKGVPAPGLSVVASGVVLALGGLGIVLGVFPAVAAAMLVGFFVVTTPAIHDFWAVPEDQRQSEFNDFTKNVQLLAAALVFLALAGQPWAYALNLAF